jgi:glycosyltransferase involved in cell wall biosynthesis
MREMTVKPLVSVIIPVYNAAKYLAEAIESVLSQTYNNVEVIAVNDGSTDNSLEVLSAYSNRIQIISSANKGIGSARNLAIHQSKGSFLAFLDADDFWELNKLEVQMQVFASNPNLDIVYCSFKEFLSPDMTSELIQKRILKPTAMSGAIAGTSLVKRTAFDKVGLFSEQWKTGEYIDWYARAKEQNLTVKHIDNCLYHRRSHSDNHTFRESESKRDYLHVLKASLDRRRGMVKD